MTFKILITKETRAQDQRVSLIPSDVQTLIAQGHEVQLEHDAGLAAGFADADYQSLGAGIRALESDDHAGYRQLFTDINLIVRVKRPLRAREILENQAIQAGALMIGALDPGEKGASHYAEYQAAGIAAHSIDQLSLNANDPRNVLASMSILAGRLALLDALAKSPLAVRDVVSIGFGTVGQAVCQAACQQGLRVTVVVGRAAQIPVVEAMGGQAVLLDRGLSLLEQQAFVKRVIMEADVIISGARQANQPAPLLIPHSTLLALKAGVVVVDMALSEGGNVEGAEHDATHVLANGVIVTNVSGYPKAVPIEASIAWSRASLHVIQTLARGDSLPYLV